MRIPAKYAEGADGKRGKQIAAARTAYLRCQAEITTNSDYTIRDIRTVADIPGATARPIAQSSWRPNRNNGRFVRHMDTGGQRAACFRLGLRV